MLVPRRVGLCVINKVAAFLTFQGKNAITIWSSHDVQGPTSHCQAEFRETKELESSSNEWIDSGWKKSCGSFGETAYQLHHLGGGNSMFCSVHPYLGKMNPICYRIFFKMGWFNHQPVINYHESDSNFLPYIKGPLVVAMMPSTRFLAPEVLEKGRKRWHSLFLLIPGCNQLERIPNPC